MANFETICGDFAFSYLGTILGGSVEAYFQSASTTANVWAECHKNSEILTLVGMYLVGSSQRAEHNLGRLRAKLISVFELEGVA